MNPLNCDIARDLLPLYHDGVCSEASRRAVEAHLARCPACREEMARMDTALTDLSPAETEPLRAAEKAWNTARKRSFRKGLCIAAGIFLGIALLAGVFFCFFSVDRMFSRSMEPTLADGELCLFQRNAVPGRDDIVAARTTWLAEHGIKDTVRVVGLPGDVIELRDRTLYVNGEPAERYPAGTVDPGDRAYPVTLEADEYFVLGDNLDNSFDSRFLHYGLLSEQDILGVYVASLPRLWNPFVHTAAAQEVMTP